MSQETGGAGAVLLHPTQPATALTGYEGHFPAAALALARIRLSCRLSWLRVICIVSASLLVLELFHPAAYNLPSLRACTEGVITLLAIISALLFRAQFTYTRRLRDLILLGTLVTFALLEFVSNVVPAAVEVHSGSQFAASLQLGQLFVAVAVMAAAVVPSSKLVVGGRRPVLTALGLSVVACAAAELGGVILRHALIAAAPRPVPGIGHALAHPLATVVVIGAAVLLLDAAARFRHRARLDGNSALSMLGAAAILLALARLYYLAFPWVSLDWITSGELLGLLALGLIVAAAARQEREARAGMARAASIVARLRVARDLHDGLAQDLAFIAAHGARMAGELGAEHPLAVAARRVLAASRGTISDLSDSRSSTPRDALGAVAGELSERFGIAIAVDADADADLSLDAREQVLRITREAIANAARHGRAKNVTVSLVRAESGLALRVNDDGAGIRADAATPPQDGFGLRSMRERAATLSGSLTVRERNRGGTELEVLFP